MLNSENMVDVLRFDNMEHKKTASMRRSLELSI